MDLVVSCLPVRGDERADGDGSLQPLFHIQITGRLVEHKTAAEKQKRSRKSEVKGQIVTVESAVDRFLTCRPSGCRRRRRRTSAALLRTDPPRSSLAGGSDLFGNNQSQRRHG